VLATEDAPTVTEPADLDEPVEEAVAEVEVPAADVEPAEAGAEPAKTQA
jgi:hypothetical protein